MRDRSNSKKAATTYSVERNRGPDRLETVPGTVITMPHALFADDFEGTVKELQGHCTGSLYIVSGTFGTYMM